MTDRLLRDRTGDTVTEDELLADPVKREIERCRQTLERSQPPRLTNGIVRRAVRDVVAHGEAEAK